VARQTFPGPALDRSVVYQWCVECLFAQTHDFDGGCFAQEAVELLADAFVVLLDRVTERRRVDLLSSPCGFETFLVLPYLVFEFVNTPLSLRKLSVEFFPQLRVTFVLLDESGYLFEVRPRLTECLSRKVLASSLESAVSKSSLR